MNFRDIDILGGGPSLQKFVFPPQKPFIYVNSLISVAEIRKSSFGLYVAHERRLFGPELVQELKAIDNSESIFIGGKLKDYVRDYINSFQDIESIIEKNQTAFEVYSEGNDTPDMMKNVVLDFAVPLAVALGAKKINLYGCDFDYGNSVSPNYYVPNIGRFEHNRSTANAWKKSSYEKLQKHRNTLNERGISLCQII